MSVAEAMEAGFLPALDKDQAYMFTQSELLLYQHAQDQRLLTRDILRAWVIPVFLVISLACQLDDSCPFTAPWLTPDSKSYPGFRCTVEVRRGTRPAAAARQPGAEMNET